jgi:hypothetical protein
MCVSWAEWTEAARRSLKVVVCEAVSDNGGQKYVPMHFDCICEAGLMVELCEVMMAGNIRLVKTPTLNSINDVRQDIATN